VECQDGLTDQGLQSAGSSLLCVCACDWRSGVKPDAKSTSDHLPVAQSELLLLFGESVKVCSWSWMFLDHMGIIFSSFDQNCGYCMTSS